LLPLPLALGGVTSKLESEARALGRRAGAMVPGAGHEPRLVSPIDRAGTATTLTSEAARPEAGAPGAPRRPARRAKPRRAAHAVFIGHDTMLRLVNSGVIPEGRPVPRTAQRPGGIQLSGVQALGIGLEEGDVLTEVEGRSVTEQAQVVTTVLVALARRTPTMSGAFFRKGERWSLIVEIPYDARPPAAR
jgi:hypothetical protein